MHGRAVREEAAIKSTNGSVEVAGLAYEVLIGLSDPADDSLTYLAGGGDDVISVSEALASRFASDNIVIRGDMTLDSLKHFKDDVREVKAGLECGLKISGFDDLKVDDVIEFFQIVKIARTL